MKFLALSGQAFVKTLYLRYECLHFLEIGAILSVKLDFNFTILGLYLGDSFLLALFFTVLFQFCELAGLIHFQKAFNVSVVPEFWHCHEIIEEIF